MNSGNGSQELTRLSTAYRASIVFGASSLIASAAGVDVATALWRGVIAGGVALVAGNFLAPPVIDVVLAALARDEAKRQAELEEEADE